MKLLVVIAVILAALVFGWCSPKVWDEVNLMPPPDVFGDGLLNPLPYEEPMKDIPYGGMLYATDRAPATDDDRENYYLDDRGQVLRLGVANISLHEPQVSWEEIRNLTLLKNRVRNYPLRVTGIDEFGVLEDSIPAFADPDKFDSDARDGDDQYAAAINAQLARSGRKDIYVYVHGYRVVFENPMLVASELWHFLGYDGVMIGYAWPSTPSKWAYLRDTDTSNGFARHFRLFLKFLSEHTDAEAIHVIGYSAGTRMVARAYEQIALMYNYKSREQFQGRFRLGNLILVGSDLDRDVFSTYLEDGALDVPKHLSVYVSSEDRALDFSRWLTRRERLGQMFEENALSPTSFRLLSSLKDHISIIDVTDAEGSNAGNGHGYFRSSPWVSSDVLMMLMYGLSAEQRGLVRNRDMAVWEFPPDYLERLWSTLSEVSPNFKRAFLERQAAEAVAE